ncbi:MAG: hypothetical protein HY978_04580 [Candidatus Liptonbacteria bacterium]|nr:hypothetical protein [Candidatus Liptonbacteria bacterium]
MFITVINDCQDPNAGGRQLARLQSLLGWPATLIGVSGDLNGRGELEAAGNLVDVLDAAEGRPGIVLVNVAPRSGELKHWPNGSPFGYFFHQKTLVLSSLAGLTLSLVKKLKVVPRAQILNIPEVLDAMIQRGHLNPSDKERITTSQFRSYEFLPRAARWLFDGLEIPSRDYELGNIPNAPRAVWWVDNFGNCKTTLLPEDVCLIRDGVSNRVNFQPGEVVSTTVGQLVFYRQLREVPRGAPALVVGSSGIGGRRFLEIVLQGGGAAEHLSLRTGSLI